MLQFFAATDPPLRENLQDHVIITVLLPYYIEWQQLWLVLGQVFRGWEVFLVLFQQFRQDLVFVVELFEVDVAWHERYLEAFKQGSLCNLLVLVDCQEMNQVVVHVFPYL